MKYLWMPWRRAFDFSGRSTRREYWSYVGTFYAGLFAYLLLVGALFPDEIGEKTSQAIGAVTLLLFLFSALVGLAAGVRRLHDHDKTGWFILLAAVPAIGWLFFLFMMLTPGTDGPNSYGSNPRDPHADMSEVAGVFS